MKFFYFELFESDNNKLEIEKLLTFIKITSFVY